MSTTWAKVGERLREIAREESARVSPPVQRFRVARVDPLRLEEIAGDEILEEGDSDVEIADSVTVTQLVGDPPNQVAVRLIAVGDMAVVHQDAGGDWIVSGYVSGGDDA